MTKEKIRKLIISEDRFKELLIIEQQLEAIFRINTDSSLKYIDEVYEKEIERILKTNYADRELSDGDG